MSATTDGDWLDFDIHGVLGLRVSRSAPASERLHAVLGEFAVDHEVAEDVLVRGELEHMLDAVVMEDDVVHNASAVHFRRRRLQVVADGARYRLNGSGDLDVALLAVLDLATPSRDAAIVHAASISYHGCAIALPAARGVDMSGVVASLAGRPGYGVMGDEWALLSADGRLLAFGGPASTQDERSAYGSLVRAAQARSVGTPVSKSLERLAEAVRRRRPRHVHPVAPPGRKPEEAPLLTVAFVERYEGARTRVVKRDRDWMVQRLLGDFTTQLPRASRDVLTCLAATSHLALGPFLEEKAGVVDAALADSSCFVVQVPSVYDAGVVSEELVRVVEDLLKTLVAEGRAPSGVGIA